MAFGEGSQKKPVIAHFAPSGEPFNLQIAESALAGMPMTAAPVPKGGVSFHHGGTVHQSGTNRSKRWRRACALHYVRNDNAFVAPALSYDASMFMRIT